MTPKEMVSELDTALKMLGVITLAGDAVDVMAAAKAKIRRVKDDLAAADKGAASNG